MNEMTSEMILDKKNKNPFRTIKTIFPLQKPGGNKGYSLVELIIVIAIMAILTSSVAYGFGMIRNNDLKKCSNQVSNSLATLKTQCLGKKSANCIFYKAGDDLMCRMEVNGTVISDEKIGGKQISLKYKVAATKGDYQVTDADVRTVGALGSGDELIISFDHSSGALKPYDELATPKTYVYNIFVCKKDKNVRYTAVPATGKLDVK